MMRRSFWVSAMRVYFVVSDGSFASPSAISRARGRSLSPRNDLVDGAPILGRLCVELLVGEDEITAAYWADRFLPQQMDAIARHDDRCEVWLVLKDRRWSGQNDVGEQDKFGVQPCRADDRGDQRRFDVEDVHQDLSALAINLVIASRGEKSRSPRG